MASDEPERHTRRFVVVDDEHLGLAFKAKPPERVFVKKIKEGTWAFSSDIEIGDEIIAVNDIPCATLDLETFKDELKKRPLTLDARTAKAPKAEDGPPAKDPALLGAQVDAEGKEADDSRAEAKAAMALREREEAAAIRIQAMQRGRLARNKVKTLREEAAEDALAFAPGAAEQPQRAQEAQQAAALGVPASARGQEPKGPAGGTASGVSAARQARMEAEERRKQVEARMRKYDPQEEAAAIRIQAVHRGRLARKEVAERRKLQEAAPLENTIRILPSGLQLTSDANAEEAAAAARIQATHRGNQVRKELARQHEQEDAAATKVQAMYRGNHARKELAQLQDGSAVPASQPKSQARKQLPHQQQHAGEAADATKVQALYRGNQARKEFGHQRKEAAAATKVQALYRGNQARKEFGHQRKEAAAATKVQALYRGNQAIKEFGHQPKKEKAGAWSPGMQPRTSLAEASMLIQAASRGWKERRVLGRVRESPVVVELSGFSRGVINGRYVNDGQMADAINGHPTYVHESGGSLIYYCEEHEDWRVTRNRQTAMRKLGVARSLRAFKVDKTGAGMPWMEWDADTSTWLRQPLAHVSTVEIQGHASFVLALSVAASVSIDMLEFAIQMGTALCAGRPVSPAWVEVFFSAVAGAAPEPSGAGDDGAERKLGVKVRLSSPSGTLLPPAVLARLQAPLLQARLEEQLGYAISDDDGVSGVGFGVEGLAAGRCEATRIRITSPPRATAVPSLALGTLSPSALGLTGGGWSSASAERRSSSASAIGAGSGGRRGGGAVARAMSARPAKRRGALESFKELLLTRAPSFANAWRRLLDPHQQGFINFATLCTRCHRLGWRLDVRSIFKEMDVGEVGRMTLHKLDFATVEALSFFRRTLIDRYSSVEASFTYIGVAGGRRLNREEFCTSLLNERLATGDEAAELFHMLSNSKMAAKLARYHDPGCTATVGKAEMQWLENMAPWLPHKLDKRVFPGMASPEKLRDDVSTITPTSSPAKTEELGATMSDYAALSAAPSGAEGDASEGQFWNRSAVYDRLAAESAAFYERKEMRALAVDKAPWRRPPDPPREPIDRLYLEVYRRQTRQKLREERDLERIRGPTKEVKSDEVTLNRLQHPRQDFTANQDKYLVFPKAPPEGLPPNAGMKACRRNYDAAALRADRRQNLLDKYKRMQDAADKELAELRVGAGVKEELDEEEFVERFYARPVAIRQNNLQANILSRAKAEEERREDMKANMVGYNTPYNDDAFIRLYADHAKYQAKLQSKRAEATEEETRFLQYNSVHRKRTLGRNAAQNPLGDLFGDYYHWQGAAQVGAEGHPDFHMAPDHYFWKAGSVQDLGEVEQAAAAAGVTSRVPPAFDSQPQPSWRPAQELALSGLPMAGLGAAAGQHWARESMPHQQPQYFPQPWEHEATPGFAPPPRRAPSAKGAAAAAPGARRQPSSTGDLHRPSMSQTPQFGSAAGGPGLRSQRSTTDLTVKNALAEQGWGRNRRSSVASGTSGQGR